MNGRMSPRGPSRQFVAKQRFGRFRRETDIDWQARSAGSVENDPFLTCETKPSWYVVASEDNAINPELEKRMAQRANAKTTILKSSHVAMLSKPNEVLDVILDAAKSVSK